MNKSIEVRVPTLGESVSEATVGNWFKKAGETVNTDDLLCEIETDKIAIEVAAPASGVLSQIIVDEGITVEVDALLATIAIGTTDSKSVNKNRSTIKSSGNLSVESEKQNIPESNITTGLSPTAAGIKNAPSAEKLMADNMISDITGSGRDGRIMKHDVLAALSKVPASPVDQTSTLDAEPNPKEERVKMSRLRQTIAQRLKQSQNTAAILTTYNEVDMSAIMALRGKYKDLFIKKHSVKLGFMSFFIKACCHALAEIPAVNAEIQGDTIVYKNYVNMGVAVGTPAGLVVPVLRNADQMSFAAIEQAITQLSGRARSGKLAIADMQGGSFTITNGGVYGSLLSTPIINPPQSGILGMHSIQKRAIVINDTIVIRPMMYIALSYDHRIVDGQGAVTFLVRVKQVLEDPQRLLIDL